MCICMKGEHMGSKNKKQNSWCLGVKLCPFLVCCFILYCFQSVFFPYCSVYFYVSMATMSLCQGAIPVCLLLRG